MKKFRLTTAVAIGLGSLGMFGGAGTAGGRGLNHIFLGMVKTSAPEADSSSMLALTQASGVSSSGGFLSKLDAGRQIELRVDVGEVGVDGAR
jgi:hypothetical protein